MANRRWKDIKGYEGYYKISDDGLVFSVRKNKVLKTSKTHYGYEFIVLYAHNTEKTHLIHRLVANEFIPNPNNYPCVNHKDEIRNNNKVENLEWCTHKYNNNYGTYRERNSKSHINHSSISKKVICLKNGVFLKEYPSMREAERQTGIKNQNISKCCNNRVKTAGGYEWKLKTI